MASMFPQACFGAMIVTALFFWTTCKTLAASFGGTQIIFPKTPV
jgi:hypothetical protein